MRNFPYRILVVCSLCGAAAIGCGDTDGTDVFGNATSSSSSGKAGAGGEGGSAGPGGAGGKAGAGGGATGGAGGNATGGAGGNATGGAGGNATGGAGGNATGGAGGNATGGAGGAGGGGPCMNGQTQMCFTGDPKTLGVGICMGGTQTCTNGMFGPCVGEVTAKTETCNSIDDDCNGTVDDGCQCPNGAMQNCYGGPAGTQGVGPCKGGTQTCVNGMWGVCMGDVVPAAEQCDGLDNDCSGQADDGNPGGGASCMTGLSGVCALGTTACTNGSIKCNQNTTSSPEVCDGLDNDCNGQLDEGNPGGGMVCMTGKLGACAVGTSACSTGMIVCKETTLPMPEACDNVDNDCNGMVDDMPMGVGMACNTGMPGVCAAGTTTCTGGAIVCTPNTMASAEMCDGLDNDCDGTVDNGNPGGGVMCGPSLGACTTQTACVAGAIVCRGTFAAPGNLGSSTNPGTQALPLSTIAAAQANAILIGGGADVCLCDPGAGAATAYNEDVTMVEGVSVLGGYSCADWSRNITTYVTTIRNTTTTGVKFPAGITSITALDGITVVGLAANMGTSSAITVTDSSPSLLTVTATGGQAPTSIGLNVSSVNGGMVSPTVNGGAYSALAVGNGSNQTAVNLSKAAGNFTNVTMTGAPASGVGAATTSVGLRCTDCPGTTITGGTINGVTASTTVAGLWASGNVAGLSVTNTNISGGQVTTAGGIGYGARFDTCTGASTLTTANILGGTGANGSRFGVDSTGAACAPAISGGTVRGCESGANCTGMSCATGSLCTATNATIRGASATAATTAYGVRCATNACGTFSGNTITVATMGNNATTGMGIDIIGTNPAFDDNDISSPVCPNGVGGNPRLYGAHFSNTTSLVTNNIIHDQTCLSQIDVVRFDKLSSAGGALGPTIHSNTIQYTTCNGCGAKRGLVIAAQAGALTPAAGIVRNNIFRNAGTMNQNTGFAVRENDTQSDLSFFQNNDMWTPGGTLYFDEGAAPLLLVAINALTGSTANINADPQLDATFHLLMGSPCRNAGTATGAPALDFDANMRPQEMLYDIGADEFVP